VAHLAAAARTAQNSPMATEHDLTHLAALIESAKAEAKRLGSNGANVADLLGEALNQVRNIAAHGGHPDQGLAPSELTTEND
jgi:hypothetical protein